MLIFTGAPVREVVAELARCYNAVIRVDGKDLANERVGLEVAVRRVSLSQVLDLVGVAANAHVRRDGDAFVLVPGRDVATPRDKQQPKPLPQPEKIYGR
jgi:ferric-dicitrate binding protein FerR (iron transport regulator)